MTVTYAVRTRPVVLLAAEIVTLPSVPTVAVHQEAEDSAVTFLLEMKLRVWGTASTASNTRLLTRDSSTLDSAPAWITLTSAV